MGKSESIFMQTISQKIKKLKVKIRGLKDKIYSPNHIKK
jgi:hypothetical protein